MRSERSKETVKQGNYLDHAPMINNYREIHLKKDKEEVHSYRQLQSSNNRLPMRVKPFKINELTPCIPSAESQNLTMKQMSGNIEARKDYVTQEYLKEKKLKSSHYRTF
jgi:hypothetical protein